MLRYCYLLSLLICINNSFCYEYTSDIDSNRRGAKIRTDRRYQRENFQDRKHRKRHDYDILDKDPVAEIDVASFINSAEDESISENDPYNLQDKTLYAYNLNTNSAKRGRDAKQDNYYGGLTNDLTNSNEDYLDMEAENLQESSHDGINFNLFSKDKIISDEFTHGFDKDPQYNLNDNVIDRNKNHHKEKKCALKNIKLPFFSHNKSTIAKVKKDKRRKKYGFYNSAKGNIIRKSSKENLLKHDKSRENSKYEKHNNIRKRSYIERFCPACRRKFITSKTLKSQTKRRNTYLDSLSKTNAANLENTKKHVNTDHIDTVVPSSEKETIEYYWNDRRRKREDDDRNIERQKELEYLEKRVESVTVNNPSYHKTQL